MAHEESDVWNFLVIKCGDLKVIFAAKLSPGIVYFEKLDIDL